MGIPAYIKRFALLDDKVIQPYMNTAPFNLKLMEISYKHKFASLLTMKFVTDSNVEVIFKNAIANNFNSDSKFEKYDINLLINKPKGQMITQETLYINQDDEYQTILPDPTYKIELPSEVKRITISNYNKVDIGAPFIDIEYKSRFEHDTNIALNLIKYTI